MGFDATMTQRWRVVSLASAVAAFAVGVLALLMPATAGENTAVMSRGDAAVTSFSGAKVWGEVPPDAHPLDRTFIDTGGSVLRVLDLTKLAGPPAGQVANAPVVFRATAGDVGQVFGVALDSDTAKRNPSIYLGATSLFGLQIVSQSGDRLVKGEPHARWMPGQFGVSGGGGPGSIWKIDGATGAVSLFANIKHDGKDNAGPGLGEIAYDPETDQLFVADLESGLIHRLGRDGSDRGTYDHGTTGRVAAGLDAIAYDASSRMDIESPRFSIEEPFTWGFADARRRVFALATQGKRLYYSVAKPLQIWSVGLNSDGSFADDARAEIDVADTPFGNLITDILFDGPDKLYLSQRGELAGSYDYGVFAKIDTPIVRQYAWNDTTKRWSEDADELAIGLKPPYRSTDGGIALNYGYGPDGTIDYGRCRETLWTTGEHLREGEDAARVTQGGARSIKGLQGTSKGNFLPANAPPYETWFVDEDTPGEGGEFYGRVGSLAIFEPCDAPAEVAEPVEPIEPAPYPLPTPVGSGIWIKKECAPAAFGGQVHCVITVTNSGSTLPDVPITFFDAATILAGPGAGGAVVIAAAAPDVPQWVCSATPTPDLTCTLPPELLPPGTSHSVEVTIDTGPLQAAGNNGFRNCSTLASPWSGVACAEGGTNIVIIKTPPAACAPGADCAFGITITNTGSQPFDGDLLLSDSMFMGPGAGAPLAAPISSIVPPLGCAPAPAALPFSCAAPIQLAPGESKPFVITATMPAGPPGGYWAHNCISASAPGVPPPALPPPAGGTDTAVSCAWVPVGAPAALSNIEIKKTALFGAKCAKMPGDVILCSYEVDLFNDGPSPFHDVITFNETVPAAATLTVGSPAWTCAGAPPVYACGSNPPGPVDIPVGGSIAIPVEISIPLAPLEAAGCGLPNSVAITAPPAAAADNFDGGDDTDIAVADAFLTWVDGLGVTHVTCDPSNLTMAKVSKGACVATGNAYRCAYTATVTNVGPDPYHGPIKVSDQLGFAPTSVTFSQPWGCSGAGVGYTCKLLHADLKKGESVTLDISVDVPGGRQCSLTNRAATIFPIAGTRFNNKSGDDFASATSKIPSPTCERPQRPRCDPGANEWRTESGACVCKPGFIRAAKLGCVGIIVLPLCADGKPVPKSGRCPGTEPACKPGPNEYRNDDGRCVCKRGYERDANKRCVEPKCEPGPNEFRDDDGRCVCKRGYERDANRRCVEPKCEPGPNEFRNDDGRCVCKRGYERDANKRCVEPKCEPGPNEYRNDDGRCVCKRGYERDTNKRCVAFKCEPGPNEFRDNDGRCVCKRGYERDANKRCVEPSSPADDCKKKGWTWTGSRCVEPTNPADECKKKGGTWTGSRCVEPSSPADECKKKGWTWTGSRCVEPSSPADECKKKGGTWTGSRCVEPSSPADDCKKKGWTWTGSRCVEPSNPADECKKKGGTWTGSRCVEPSNPADECKKKGWRWDGKRCVAPSNPADECRKKGWTWTGSRCVEPTKKSCPSGFVGTPPNCKPLVVPKCPGGTRGIFPNCKKV